MNVNMFVSGFVACLALAALSCQAVSAENGNVLADKVAKLTECIDRLSDQLAGQSEQLSKLSDKQDKQAEQQSEQLYKLSDNQEKQAEQLTELSNRQDKQAEQHERLSSQLSESSTGPTFIRWGKRSCNGTNSKIVYTGVAAGSHSSNIGGTANLHCLPRDPTFGNYDSVGHYGHDLVVAEYKLDPNFPFDTVDPLLNNDVPCAVCEVTNGSSVMMIPGRVDCYSDWRLEYRGYLMGEAWDKYRSEDVCVDENPEVDYSGVEPAAGSVGLYPVDTWCDDSSMPCPPYGHLWELACAVCSK